MPNPTTGGPSTDVSNLDAAGLLTSGTASNTAFLATLDQIATGLAALQAAGVVVILRPFWEMNGDWFWWSKLSIAQFISLWQFTHNYLTNTKGLTNLLWLYSVNAGIGNVTAWFPTAVYADLTGFDIYTSDPGQGASTYTTLASIGLPICISEFGAGSPNAGDTSFPLTALIAAIKTAMPNVVFWQQWWDGNASNVGWGMAEVQAAAPALADPRVLNRPVMPVLPAAVLAEIQAALTALMNLGAQLTNLASQLRSLL
jgi:mannan endo-1,4-beta-mannosidase